MWMQWKDRERLSVPKLENVLIIAARNENNEILEVILLLFIPA